MMIMILAFLESCKLRRILIQVAPTRVMVWPPQIKGTYENYGISTLISISIQFTVSITFTLLSKYFIHIFFFTVEVEANFRPIYYIDVIHVPQVWIGGKFSTNIYKGPGSIRNPLNLLSVMTLNFVTEKKIVTKMSSLWILQATVLQSIRWVEYEWSWVWVHQSLKFFFIFALFFFQVEKKEFRLVRFLHERVEHLGIFIARQNQVDIGCHGYFIVHILPDGLTKR